jgi:hypothetical protein
MLPRLLVATLATVFVVTVPARGHAQGRRGAPPPAATPLTHMADGQPDVQGFWGSDAYTQDLETGLPDEETNEIQGRGPVDTSKAISRIVDPAEGKIPYQPWAAYRRIHIPSFRRGETSKGEVMVFTRPWTIKVPFQRLNRPADYEAYEEACVEGTKGVDKIGFSVK